MVKPKVSLHIVPLSVLSPWTVVAPTETCPPVSVVMRRRRGREQARTAVMTAAAGQRGVSPLSSEGGA